jgi:hypothetical protein
MKATIYSFLAIFCIAFSVSNCEKNKENTNQLTFTGKLISNSPCKSGLKSTGLATGTPDSLSCIEYSFNGSENILSVKHINAGFNCCPDSLYCKVSLSSDTIIIQEFEKHPSCKCDCLFDLDIQITGVVAKKYQVKFIEPYSGEQDEINFGMDLTLDKEGSYCVSRKQYPWGMTQ